MMHDAKNNPGIKKLTKRYRTIFRIPENLNHYSKTNFHIAERKFLKSALQDGINQIGLKITTGRQDSS